MSEQDDHGFGEAWKAHESFGHLTPTQGERVAFGLGRLRGIGEGREAMREAATAYCEKAVARWLHKSGLSPEASATHLASECAYEDAANHIRNIPLEGGETDGVTTN